MPGSSEGWCYPLFVPAGHAKPDRPRLILSVLTPIQCDVQITDLGGPASVLRSMWPSHLSVLVWRMSEMSLMLS